MLESLHFIHALNVKFDRTCKTDLQPGYSCTPRTFDIISPTNTDCAYFLFQRPSNSNAEIIARFDTTQGFQIVHYFNSENPDEFCARTNLGFVEVRHVGALESRGPRLDT